MDWLKIIQECSQKIRKEALTLYGSPEAAVGFGVGAGGDTSKKIDLAAEKALIDCLNKHEISCTLVSEEAGTKQIGSQPSEFYVTTDPVDGTTNAVRGLPFIATVIAVSRRPWLRDVETALVSDLVHDITYTAQKNGGAFKNGERIKPSETSEIADAVIGVDLNTFRIEELLTKLEGLFRVGKHFRHFGANALEICYVADGSTDAFIDIRGKLRVTDMVASYLILREAGGIMVSPDGSELNVPLAPTQRLSFIAASNRRIYEAIREALKAGG
jgi:myo-inositol-1(or 4)-monophosphatase